MSSVDGAAQGTTSAPIHFGPTTKVNWLYHLASAAAVAVVGGLLFLAETTWHDSGLIVAILVGQVLLAGFWSNATATPGFPGSAVVALGAGVATDILLINSNNLRVGQIGVVIAIVLLASFAHQVTRRAPRRSLTVSIAQDVWASLVTSSFGMLILLGRIDDKRVIVSATILCICAALIVSHLVDTFVAVPRISFDVRRGAVGLVLGIAAGGAAAAYRLNVVALSDVMAYLIFGAVVSAVALLTSAGVTFLAVDRQPDAIGCITVQAILPFASAAPIALLVSLVISS